jgi:ribonuclease G
MEFALGTEIVVNKTGRETRVAIVEDGRLAEIHIDRGDRKGYVGNVYLGRVVRVLPGMQAAFVDIGLERAAFLYAGDIYPEFLDDGKSQNEIDEVDDNDAIMGDSKSRARPRNGHPPIQDLIKERQDIVVQVAKDPISTKGARVTTHITLPGRYLVFMPTVAHIGISRRIARDRERRKLRNFVNKYRPKGGGFIVRTVCAGQPTSTLKADMDFLVDEWNQIQTNRKEKKSPALLHAEPNLCIRLVRDGFTEDVQRMVIDDSSIYDQVNDFVGKLAPEFKDRVQQYRGQEPIFDTFGVEVELNKSLGHKVWLKSGGYLIIDQTEALTAIDVNSGKFVGKTSLEETTTACNLEATEEIVNQLRLRNIGGIIVLDFIDMEKASNRDRVNKALGEELKADRARTNVLRISDLGLVEMTRKRVQEDLVRTISEPCHYCEGKGHTRSRTTVVYDILREVQREHNRAKTNDEIYVNVNPDVADLMYGAELTSIENLETHLKKRIVVRAMGHYHLERYEIYSR